MSNDVIISLIRREETGVDPHGNAVYTETETLVYAEDISIRQTEFFQAAAVGFKPERCLKMYAFEYHGEQLCELDGERYNIYRTYLAQGSDRIELYLTAIVGDTNAFAEVC